MDGTTTALTLEVTVHDGVPSGTLSGPGGARHEFSGWLGLVAALDAVLAGLDRPR